MASNSYGDFRTTKVADWRAFDALPEQLRHAVNVAAQPYASAPILAAFRAGASIGAIIGAMRRADLEDTHRIYGPSHPEARRT